MSDPITLEEIKRGHILMALDNDPNGTLSTLSLSAAMVGASHEVSSIELKAHLDYLEDKKLVKLEVKNKNMTWVKRTAKGKDLLDGRITEPGILLPY